MQTTHKAPASHQISKASCRRALYLTISFYSYIRRPHDLLKSEIFRDGLGALILGFLVLLCGIVEDAERLFFVHVGRSDTHRNWVPRGNFISRVSCNMQMKNIH